MRTLKLSGQDILYLPPTFGNLRNLKFLYLDRNRLSFLPFSLTNCSGLIELNVQQNQLTYLPLAFPELQTLNISQNAFSAIPPEIAQCRSLEKLNCEKNELEVLPPEIRRCPLEELILSDNRLQKISHLVGTMKNLRVLHLTNNNIQTIPLTMVRGSSSQGLLVIDCALL